jgi:hypothetical protein
VETHAWVVSLQVSVVHAMPSSGQTSELCEDWQPFCASQVSAPLQNDES